jgi:hypothetical protein
MARSKSRHAAPASLPEATNTSMTCRSLRITKTSYKATLSIDILAAQALDNHHQTPHVLATDAVPRRCPRESSCPPPSRGSLPVPLCRTPTSSRQLPNHSPKNAPFGPTLNSRVVQGISPRLRAGAENLIRVVCVRAGCCGVVGRGEEQGTPRPCWGLLLKEGPPSSKGRGVRISKLVMTVLGLKDTLVEDAVFTTPD